MNQSAPFMHTGGSSKKLPANRWLGDDNRYDFVGLGRALRRNLPVLLLWIALCWGLGLVAVVRTPVEYTAATQVIFDSTFKKRDSLDNDAAAALLDASLAESRIQVIKSERVLRYVFDALDLKNSPYFSDQPGMLQKLTGLFTGRQPIATDEHTTAAFLQFMNKVTVRRLGLSYVVEISFRAPTPPMAAQMANAISTAYIRELVVSRQHDEEFLQRRTAELKNEATALRDDIIAGRVPDHDISDANARVISAAIEPLTKSSPQTTLILLFATAFGMFTGIGAVVIRHSTDRVVRTRRQFLRHFGLPNVVAIPDVKHVHADTGSAAGHFRQAAVLTSHKKALASITAAIVRPDQSDPGLTVGVLSWSKGAGTSSIAYSLSTLFADCNQRVVLADANAANPALSKSFTPNEYDGLWEVLARREASDSVAHLRSIDRIRFLPWGKQGCAEGSPMLGTWRMKLILNQLRDVGAVLVDLPPLSCASEAQTIGPLLDGIVLVIDASTTTFEDIAEALMILYDNNIVVLAVVLNRAEGIPFLEPTVSARAEFLRLFWRKLSASPVAWIEPLRSRGSART